MDHDKREEQRRELWAGVFRDSCRATSGLRGSAQDRSEWPSIDADRALAAFDERFPPEPVEPEQSAACEHVWTLSKLDVHLGRKESKLFRCALCDLWRCDIWRTGALPDDASAPVPAEDCTDEPEPEPCRSHCHIGDLGGALRGCDKPRGHVARHTFERWHWESEEGHWYALPPDEPERRPGKCLHQGELAQHPSKDGSSLCVACGAHVVVQSSVVPYFGEAST